MTGFAGAATGVVALLAVLGWAAVRPRGWPEATLAVPAAIVLLLAGVVTPARAAHTLAGFAPTLVFLAAMFVLAASADDAGVFTWLGSLIVRRSGDAVALLGTVFAVAAATTATLGLDGTVVLLTPAVIVAVRRARVHPDPPLYATAHLANTASLLLPVSNLTNLLVFHVAGITFVHFAVLMALPFAVAVGWEYVVFRLVFARELRGPSAAAPDAPSAPRDATEAARAPRRALSVLAVTFLAFVAAPLVGVPAFVVALAAAAAMTLAAGRVRALRLLAAVNVPFLLFVAALLIVVAAAVGGAPSRWVASILPGGTSFTSLLAVAAVAALLACAINNLPATLVLLAVVGPHPSAAVVLAALIGVNIGPNLTYIGSLATLLWRRVLRHHSLTPSLRRFTLLGLATVPPCLVAAVGCLWLMLRAWPA